MTVVTEFHISRKEWPAVVKLLRLSPQQARVVDLIVHGMKDKQIALALGLSISTVRTHLRQVFARLNVSDRVGVVVRVFVALEESRRGIVKTD